MTICKICGEEDCDKHVSFIGRVRKIQEFGGSSPPEIFIGKWNYPNVYTGILSPEEYGDTRELSSPEVWHERKMPIEEVLKRRNQLIYGRTQSHIKKLDTKFLGVMQEVAMTHKPIAAEFHLKKPVTKQHTGDLPPVPPNHLGFGVEQAANAPLIAHAGEVENVELQENSKVLPKVDYLVGDTQVKSATAAVELAKYGLDTSSIIKLLSAGLLGFGSRRKLVPTRWSITAVDDTLSKEKLIKIRDFKELQEFRIFHANYVGNHYVFLLLPGHWSFEVVEISMKNQGVWKDYEGFFPRKRYADDVTGAYYANRLAVCEYLERIKRQATVLVFREIRPEYTAPLGVGILRETSREAFSRLGDAYDNLKDALECAQKFLKQSIQRYVFASDLLKEYGKQKKLSDFFGN